MQVVRFHGLPAEALRELILAQGLAPDAAAAAQLAERSGGSLPRARSGRPAAVAHCATGSPRRGVTRRFRPAPLANAFDEFIAAGGKEADARRQRFRQLLLLVADVLREPIRDAPREAGDSPDAALAALDRTLEAEEQLDRNANQATLLECWLDDLAAAENTRRLVLAPVCVGRKKMLERHAAFNLEAFCARQFVVSGIGGGFRFRLPGLPIPPAGRGSVLIRTVLHCLQNVVNFDDVA